MIVLSVERCGGDGRSVTPVTILSRLRDQIFFLQTLDAACRVALVSVVAGVDE